VSKPIRRTRIGFVVVTTAFAVSCCSCSVSPSETYRTVIAKAAAGRTGGCIGDGDAPPG
jgi:hypothetical protein